MLGPQPKQPIGGGAGGGSDSDSGDEIAGERQGEGEGQRSFLAEVLGTRGSNEESSQTRATPAAPAQVHIVMHSLFHLRITFRAVTNSISMLHTS